MNKNLVNESFSHIFNDNEWFNKVLVGGFYVLFVLCGFGIVMINGFIVEFMKSLLNGNKNMPYWRNFSAITKTGWKVSLALILYYGIATFILHLMGIHLISLETAITYFILHTTLHPLVLLAYARVQTFSSCFNWKLILQPFQIAADKTIFTLSVSAVLLFLAITLGWMWIVVGWTLIVFLALLIQNAMIVLAVKDHLSSHS